MDDGVAPDGVVRESDRSPEALQLRVQRVQLLLYLLQRHSGGQEPAGQRYLAFQSSFNFRMTPETWTQLHAHNQDSDREVVKTVFWSELVVSVTQAANVLLNAKLNVPITRMLSLHRPWEAYFDSMCNRKHPYTSALWILR